MMKANSLYAYMLQKQNARLQFIFKTNIQGTHFLLHELVPTRVITPVGFKDNNRQLLLTTDHLSFYEKQDDSNPALSEYHYTAYFLANDQEYQLHVYFNHEDRLTTEPQLSIKCPDGTYKPLKNLTANSIQNLLELAIERSMPFMTPLRSALQKQIQQDIKVYTTLIDELNLLSADMQKNLVSYYDKIDQLIDLLNLIIPYHNNRQYQSELVLFEKVKANRPISATQQIKPQSSETKIEPEEHDDDLTLPMPIPLLRQRSIEKLIVQANEAYQKFEFMRVMKSTDLSQIVTALLHSNLIFQDALVATLEPGSETTEVELDNLRRLMQKNYSSRQKTLQKLLISNEFQLAEQLAGYPDKQQGIFPENEVSKLINMALMVGNAPLLHFLLAHHQIPVNTFTMGENSSPVMYCFLNSSPKSPKTDCLSVLIQHGFSLNEHDPQTNLPIAHIILSTYKHPLRQALLNNKSLTILNRGFYTSLIKELERIQALQEKPDEKISDLILEYKAAKEPISDRSRIDRLHASQLIDAQEKLAEHFGEAELLLLNFDSDVQLKKRSLAVLEQQYLAMLSGKERREFLREQTQVLVILHEIVTAHPKKEIDVVKANLVKGLSIKIELTNEKIRHRELLQLAMNEKSQKAKLKAINGLSPLVEKITQLNILYVGTITGRLDDQIAEIDAIAQTLFDVTAQLTKTLSAFEQAGSLSFFGATATNVEVSTTPPEELFDKSP
jgi:hypothetical protein